MRRIAQGCGAPLCTSVALTHVASKIKDMGAKVHAIDRRLAMNIGISLKEHVNSFKAERNQLSSRVSDCDCFRPAAG